MAEGITEYIEELEPLRVVIQELQEEADKRVRERHDLEEGWLEDLQQIHGRYPDADEKVMRDRKRSQTFINLTEPKTGAMVSRLIDLLFPTDDRNWGLKPTPYVELTERAKERMAQAEAEEEAAVQQDQQAVVAEQAAAQNPQMGQKAADARQQANATAQQAQQTRSKAEELFAVAEFAKKSCDLMEKQIDDQLKASRYQQAMRSMIEDACKLGTGVSKGPVVGDRVRKGWVPETVKDADGRTTQKHNLRWSSTPNPAIRHVDLWAFFPDMNAATVEESEGVFERHLLNTKLLKAYQKLPGVDLDALRRLIAQGPMSTVPWYFPDLRNIRSTQTTTDAKEYFHVWEYSGPLSGDMIKTIAEALKGYKANDKKDKQADSLLKGIIGEDGEVDVLAEKYVHLWFCQGELIRIVDYPYDSNECLYSVFTLSRDERSIFGRGIPSIMRDPQDGLNAGVRAMLDNAAWGAGPQIVVDRQSVKPAWGGYRFEPNKMWYLKRPIEREKPPFWHFDVPMRQQELANVIGLMRDFCDEVTGLPQIAQGEQGGTTKTAQGMTLLMNSANVVFRRIVRQFDDFVTVPNIRRFFDWNMQFNPREEIKGDMEVDARGSSVLLVKEMQAQNLLMIALQLGGHPQFGGMLRNRNLLKKLFQAHMIPADDVLLTDEEIDDLIAQSEATAEEQAAQKAMEIEERRMDLEEAKVKLEIKKLEAEVEKANMETAARRELAGLNYEKDKELAVLRSNTELDKAEMVYDIKQREIDNAERLAAAEIALTEETGQTSGGSF